MVWRSSADAMPWVGLYVCIASVMCTLAMAADVFRGFRKQKLWFPCRFFTINAASITLISIAMKLPVDLSSDLSEDITTGAKFVSIIFLVTMVANFLPSLGLMGDTELLLNMVALGILIITIVVNVLIQLCTSPFPWYYTSSVEMLIIVFALPWPFSVALTVSASRKILQHRYKELHRSAAASNYHETNVSCKGLEHNVKRYWMMAETGDPQFAIACSSVSSAFGVVCSFSGFVLVIELIAMFVDKSRFGYGKSDYKWSMKVIIIVQSIGAMVGSIAPIFRCLSATSNFNISKKWSKNHLNVFRVEKHWIQMLQLWKRSHIPWYIPGSLCKKVFHNIRYVVLNICIAFQIIVSVICNTTCLIPRSFLILCSCCNYYFFNSLPDASSSNSSNMRSEMEELYSGYVLQIEAEAKLSRRILRNALNSITQLLHESENREPRNLMKLLEKSTGFHGVIEFDNDQVPPLHSEETQNCWSLVAVTLTAIALSLPNIADSHVNELFSGMREGLEFVRHIEKTINENGELVKSRKAAGRVWTDVEVYCRWLQIDLQGNARKGRTSKEILEWLGDEAIQIVIHFLSIKNGVHDLSLRKLIAASSMYRISRTILIHCNEQETWPKDHEQLFEFISTVIADLLCACFTNLPRVIAMKCHEDAIEKREDSIRIAAQLLGRSKKILKILKARQLPNLDMDSMGYIDKWHSLPKSQIPNANGCSSFARIQPASSSPSESFVVTII